MCEHDSILEPKVQWDINVVKEELKTLFVNDSADNGHYGPFMIRLAWHCAGTFRSTDFRGGCDGSRIRWAPEIEWGSNAQLDQALLLLKPIREKHAGLSWADLIILAGSTAIEDMGGREMPFCGGRIDGSEEDALEGSAYLNDQIYLDAELGTAEEIRETMRIMGFTEREMTVLNGGGHSVGKTHVGTSGFEGPWTTTPTTVSNSFFTTLLDNEWTPEILMVAPFKVQQKIKDADDSAVRMLITDLRFKEDAGFREHAEFYANDNEAFLDDFAAAWLKLVNADRYNVNCPDMDTHAEGPTASPTASPPSSPTAPDNDVGGASGLDILLSCVIAFFTLVIN